MKEYYCNKDDKSLPLLADFLRVISEENRLKIICFLRRNEECCVCEIQNFLALPQNLVSHHLKVLRDFKLLKSDKRGLNVYYSIHKEELDAYKNILNKILADPPSCKAKESKEEK